MNVTETYAKWFRRILPSPFTIAIILTIITLIGALVVADKPPSELFLAWQDGLWNSNLLTFAFQMMFMLVLGHVLALSEVFDKLIISLVSPLKSAGSAIIVVAVSTILVAYLNWGLGLIFGAIIARKVGEHFSNSGKKINYPLVGATGYVGLMVWHGGLSGSSLVKVAEKGHLSSISSVAGLPDAITFDQTVFSTMNVTSMAMILFAVPLLVYFLARKQQGEVPDIQSSTTMKPALENKVEGAERLDQWAVLSKLSGISLLGLAAYIAWGYDGGYLGYITPNYINFCLLGFGLLLHKNFSAFLGAVDSAIKGAGGILIQFPLYFGILALLKVSGLIELTSQLFVAVSNQTTFPLLTFLSAGLVNIFVPSGGGQWAIQGPVILEAATSLNVPLNKCIMALAYGDQLTNMLQPFWALPLLSITGLKAKDILPYTMLLMLLGGVIFTTVLLIF